MFLGVDNFGKGCRCWCSRPRFDEPGTLCPTQREHFSDVTLDSAASWTRHFMLSPPSWNVMQLSGVAGVAVAAALAWSRFRTRPIYLLDFACFRPDESLKVTYQRFLQGSINSGWFDEEALEFQRRILEKSALSEHTFFPPPMFEEPPNVSITTAREEAETVMFAAVAEVLEKTGLRARDVDVLVTNCSLFCPTPSLAAMVIHRFGMRSDVDAYNLGGMGCSAGLLATSLAAKLLRERRGPGLALVVSTENITQNWYPGKERSMLIPNTIFRMGAAAQVLSSAPMHRLRAKYALRHAVRVHLGADEKAYRCVYQHPDGEGKIGVELNKDLVGVAARALTVNLGQLGPRILPWSEKLAFAANWAARSLLGQRQVKPYVPDFTRAIDHFCLHAGGRAVVEGLSAQLGLSARHSAPSANTLHWYGNTSSSTVWYSLGYVEAVQGIRRGDRVWQIAFGSGFKCNSLVWESLRAGKTSHRAWDHICGHEDEAARCFAAIADQNARERAVKLARKVAEAIESEGVDATVNGLVNGRVNGTHTPVKAKAAPVEEGTALRRSSRRAVVL